MKIEPDVAQFYPVVIRIDNLVEDLYLRYFEIVDDMMPPFDEDNCTYPLELKLDMHETSLLVDNIGKEIDTAMITRFAFAYMGVKLDEKKLHDTNHNVYFVNGTYGIRDWRVEFLSFWESLLDNLRMFLLRFNFVFSKVDIMPLSDKIN